MAPKHFSRRNFLKTGSLGTLAGVLAAGQRIPAEAAAIRAPFKDNPFPCAVIGFGEWGREIAAAIEDIENRLRSYLSSKVALKHSPKKGKIIIEYAGNDDLQRILEKIGLEE